MMMTNTSENRRKSRSRGFSLLELMSAIALMVLLASFAIPAYTGYIDDARVSSAIADIGRISIELERFATNNNGEYPATLADVGLGGLTDPWGNTYYYLNIALAGKGKGALRKDKNLVPINTDYDLYSAGEDGATVPPLTAKPSRDDIVRANNGNFVGLGEDF